MSWVQGPPWGGEGEEMQDALGGCGAAWRGWADTWSRLTPPVSPAAGVFPRKPNSGVSRGWWRSKKCDEEDREAAWEKLLKRWGRASGLGRGKEASRAGCRSLGMGNSPLRGFFFFSFSVTIPVIGKAEFLFQMGQGGLLAWGKTQEKLPESLHRTSPEVLIVETKAKKNQELN